MTTKYLEIDSTYRNRQIWPSQANFEVEITRPNADDDPISDSMPYLAWGGNLVSIAASVVSGTTTNVVITAAGLPQILNYETNAIFSPPGIRISSYKYLGANQAEVTLTSPLFTAFPPGTAVTITDPTDLTVLRVFVPGMKFNTPQNFFLGQLLYDETTGGYSVITSYENGIVTVASAIPGWAVTDSFDIRAVPPSQVGVAGITSTPNTIVGVTAVQLGSFARILPNYPTVAPGGQVSRIVAYNPINSTATINPPLTASPAGMSFEILPYSGPNTRQLTYSGTTQVECVNSTIRLLDLIIPNELISVGYGGKPTDYPYFYVQLTPRDSSNININCSNNPHSTNMLFRATYIQSTIFTPTLPFVKFSGDFSAVRVRFKVDSDIKFRVTLPNGQPLEFIQKDTSSPSRPNPLLQISALFEVVRDHGVGVVYSGAYGSH